MPQGLGNSDSCLHANPSHPGTHSPPVQVARMDGKGLEVQAPFLFPIHCRLSDSLRPSGFWTQTRRQQSFSLDWKSCLCGLRLGTDHPVCEGSGEDLGRLCFPHFKDSTSRWSLCHKLVEIHYIWNFFSTNKTFCSIFLNTKLTLFPPKHTIFLLKRLMCLIKWTYQVFFDNPSIPTFCLCVYEWFSWAIFQVLSNVSRKTNLILWDHDSALIFSWARSSYIYTLRFWTSKASGLASL